MGYPHHKRGCIDCGMFRNRDDMFSKAFDVYFLDKNARTLMRVGFCKDCFERGNFDKQQVKMALYESEKQHCCESRHMTDAEAEEACFVFGNAEFVSFIQFKDFWDRYNEKTVHDYIRGQLDAR